MRIALLTVLACSAVAFAQVPGKLGYQGRLLNADGTPVTGPHSFTFTIYDAPTGGTALWSEVQLLGLSDGYYAAFLGAVADGGVPTGIFNGPERYLELSVGGSTLSPRQAIDSVAYAFTSMNVSGGSVNATTVNATSISINGNTVIDSSGHLLSDAGVGVTSVSGNAPVSVANGTTTPVISIAVGTGAGTVAAGNDSRFGNATALQTNPITAGTPGVGQVLTWSGSAWVGQSLPGASQLQSQFITATGTWTSPANITAATRFKLTLLGGGGGGGSATNDVLAVGGGGGAGATTIAWVSGLAPSTGYAVTVGAAGHGVFGAGYNGTSGTVTQIVINATAYRAQGGAGGGGAPSAMSGGPGAGGTTAGANGTINAGGAPGMWGAASVQIGGNGGSTMWGGAGPGNTQNVGGDATGFGAGGGGAGGSVSLGNLGGSGAPGALLVEWNG